MNRFLRGQESTRFVLRIVKVCCCLLALSFCGFVLVAAAQNQAPAQAQNAAQPSTSPQQPTAPAAAPAAPVPVGVAAQNAPAPAGEPATPNVVAAPAPAAPPGPPPVEPVAKPPSPEHAPIVQATLAALMKDEFTYVPNRVIDPFKPFISPVAVVARGLRAGSDDDDGSHELQKPLTPLQKMTVAEVEKGLRAITWGEYGRKAVIEDGAGKGYIVSIGTPVSDKNGVISQIFNDRLIIQQENWDRETKRMVPQDTVVRLKKKDEK
ncbi:MAG TPA: hypothetical protein PK250_01510 [Syntrophobacter fumaroxidans]|nr:hypothetical protein [Syntrophobacter fumaroxidans]